MVCFSDLRPGGERVVFKKLWKKDVLLIVGKKNAEFTDHRDIWQSSHDKEETNKANSATVLKSAPTE